MGLTLGKRERDTFLVGNGDKFDRFMLKNIIVLPSRILTNYNYPNNIHKQ